MKYEDDIKMNHDLNAEYERRRSRNEVWQNLMSACLQVAVTNQASANMAMLTGILNERN